MESGNVPPAPRPREDVGGGTPWRTGVGETSVACCVGGSPNPPEGTLVNVAGDDDAGVPRDGVEGRLGIDADVDVDGEEEGGGNGDRVRRPWGVSTGEGDDNCCIDGE
jgi:hypothetical protein